MKQISRGLRVHACLTGKRVAREVAELLRQYAPFSEGNLFRIYFGQ